MNRDAATTAAVRDVRESRITTRQSRSRLKPFSLVKIAVFIAALVPALYLAYRGYRFDLTANPVTYITHFTGDWTIALLIVSLGVTPLRRLTGWNQAIKLRRMLGLFAFFYGTLHLLTWVVIDKYFDWAWMWEDIAERPFITIGMLSWVIMLALAVTSNQRSIRLLGRKWQHLHRLVYVAAIAGVVHFWWLVKADITLPRRWAVALAILFLVRIWWMLRRRMLSSS